MSNRDGDRLTASELSVFRQGYCPDCERKGLLEGPHGGLSINVYCGAVIVCGSRFNDMGPFGVDRISDARPKTPPPVPGSSLYRGWSTTK